MTLRSCSKNFLLQCRATNLRGWSAFEEETTLDWAAPACHSFAFSWPSVPVEFPHEFSKDKQTCGEAMPVGLWGWAGQVRGRGAQWGLEKEASQRRSLRPCPRQEKDASQIGSSCPSAAPPPPPLPQLLACGSQKCLQFLHHFLQIESQLIWRMLWKSFVKMMLSHLDHMVHLTSLACISAKVFPWNMVHLSMIQLLHPIVI